MGLFHQKKTTTFDRLADMSDEQVAGVAMTALVELRERRNVDMLSIAEQIAMNNDTARFIQQRREWQKAKRMEGRTP